MDSNTAKTTLSSQKQQQKKKNNQRTINQQNKAGVKWIKN